MEFLGPPHLAIGPRLVDQVLVPTTLSDVAVLNHEDLVGVRMVASRCAMMITVRPDAKVLSASWIARSDWGLLARWPRRESRSAHPASMLAPG